MPPSSPRVSIPLELSADHPALLQGLDALLKLGLLSDRQIRDICRRSLSSPLPSVKPAVRTPAAQPVAASTAKVTSQTATSRPAPTPKKPGLIQSAIGRLMAELSIVWLLCLGVFLVVVSSALLAATQWASFSPSAQYLVLFAYTAVFWLIGLWASRQTHLALTAKTLQTVSLLLVPINLWAMHGLQITASGTGLLVAIAATLLLGLGSLSSFWQYGGDRADASVWLNGCAFLALAVGHWLRWATPTAAIVIYGSLGLTAIALVAQPQVRQGWRASSNTSSSGSPVLNSARLMVIYALGVVLLRGITIEPIEPDTLGLAVGGTGALLCSLALPAWRPSRSGSSKSKSVAQNNSDRTREPKSSSQTEAIPSQQAHSADATAAVANPFGDRPLIEPSPARPSTTRSSLTRSRSDQVSAKSAAPSISQDPKTGFTSLWILVGRSLMLVGWAMAITHLPLQALGVSVMGLVLRTDRLKRLWLRRDLSVALLLGLHIIWLNWRSLSETWQSAAIAAAEQLIGDVNAGSWVLTGLAYLPYVVLTVGIADALVRRGKDKLAGLAFNWAFLLGSGLTLISAFDGTVLAINLIASALTFLVVTLRRRRRGHKIEGWVYFTHGLGLVAIAAAISDAVDDLSPEAITLCCFSLVAVELGLSVGRRNPWRRSAWLFGLGLVGLGDWLLLNYGLSSQIGLSWLLLGLVPPVVLTLICTRPAPQQRRASYPLAIATLLFAVVLCLGSATTRPAGLGIAALLAVLLTALRPGGAIASLTVGLGLGFIASTIQDLIPDAPLLTGVQWYPIGAIACGLLWLSWRGLSYRSQTTAAEEQTQWINAYRTACNGWGFALCFGLLVLLSGELILRYFNVRDFEPTYAWAAGGLAVAGLLRSGRSLHGSAWFAIG
ncbi:MAG: hypothetical protein AAGF66_14035, partial [Cyanobacteria bacterium P01_H01_bin.119]